ncbi:MAG: IreB family regulatory phosphoprotein [Oscillospiraceae bacterium]|jgi:uncharacterized protein (UPF0297 family)|nr:IreB family regulatory phosphoprotein [Oscillospiraceae bacterium]
MDDYTRKFTPVTGGENLRASLTEVSDALEEKGYNAVNQIIGYLLSEDPTYITSHRNARSLICKLDRDELLSAMLRSYLGK